MEIIAFPGMVGKPKDLEDIGVYGKILFKWTSGKQDGRA
jgi:hypothetical protein